MVNWTTKQLAISISRVTLSSPGTEEELQLSFGYLVGLKLQVTHFTHQKQYNGCTLGEHTQLDLLKERYSTEQMLESRCKCLVSHIKGNYLIFRCVWKVFTHLFLGHIVIPKQSWHFGGKFLHAVHDCMQVFQHLVVHNIDIFLTDTESDCGSLRFRLHFKSKQYLQYFHIPETLRK